MVNNIIKRIKRLNKRSNDKDFVQENNSDSKSTKDDNGKEMQSQKQKDHKQRDKIVLKVFRVNYTKDKSHSYDKFEIPLQKSTTVLDALIYAKSYLDNSIAIRYSCRMASCGSCGMKINGIPRLACYTNLSEFEEEDTITCDPLVN